MCLFGTPLGRWWDESTSREERVLHGWAKAHAPEDPVDGVVSAAEGVLWSGGVVPQHLEPASTCLWGWPRCRARPLQTVSAP